jgi:2-oxoglutarate ferredoxin oxidoreductase subunit beta
MPFGAFPIALGVLYCDPAPTFEGAVVDQRARAAGRNRDLTALLNKGETWTVGPAG